MTWPGNPSTSFFRSATRNSGAWGGCSSEALAFGPAAAGAFRVGGPASHLSLLASHPVNIGRHCPCDLSRHVSRRLDVLRFEPREVSDKIVKYLDLSIAIL